MEATHKGKRITDRFQLIPTWQRVAGEQNYRSSFEAVSDGDSPGQSYARTFASIIENGVWLQRAVSEKSPLALQLADELSRFADLSNNLYEDSPRERVAAAYLLWPFHSARYYGFSVVEKSERLKSRQSLCDIQAILYNNVRSVLDVLRLWFDCQSDVDAKPYLVDESYRKQWRPDSLIGHTPDLCAVDFLAEHMLEVMKARPLVRKAIESIQSLSLRPDPGDTCSAVLQAFKELRVAQMTVFYHPNPGEVRGRDEIPLYELVHETRDTDPLPEKLIPFGDDEGLAKNFRRLASTIYSIREKDKDDFPNFFAHRYSTIGRLNETTSFISDGRTSNYFLSTKPPVQAPDELNSNGDSVAGESKSLWPLWYRQALSDVDFDLKLPDWSDHFWWSSVGRDELKERLFPGPMAAGQIHQNDHMSAYWDDLVVTRNEFADSIEIPDQHPTGEPTFGYLMELLLRRERETRTSFFFALAQTYEQTNPRLCQFVGGTFLGLERPGIPFSKDRFEAIAARVRGLVMAVAHFSTTQAVKRTRWQAEQERSDFDKRVKLIVSLLRGSDEEKRFPRDGHLLFATPVRDKTDHDYIPRESLGWKPSRYQIKSVFTGANHLHELPKTSVFSGGDCDNTWKALFYLGGTSNTNNKLGKFWRESQEGDVRATPFNLSDRALACQNCFQAALEFLLSRDMYASLQDKVEISRKAIRLPTRPGIRFLIALCRFIIDVQSQSSPENTSIERIEFHPNSVIMTFDKSKLIERLWDRKKFSKPGVVHTVGIFKLLESCMVLPKKRGTSPASKSLLSWPNFLNSPEFARPLKVEKDRDDRRLVLRWEI